MYRGGACSKASGTLTHHQLRYSDEYSSRKLLVSGGPISLVLYVECVKIYTGIGVGQIIKKYCLSHCRSVNLRIT